MEPSTSTIRQLDSDESYEIDTPNGAVTLVRPGKYRIDADPERETTTVTVRGGDAEITAGGQAFPVHARQSAFITGTDAPSTEVREALSSDNFDRWWQTRDDREDRRPPPRYVSRDMVGYEDLDEYGTWRDDPDYGNVWVPRTVAAGWAPYHDGHWAMVEPWGWTWIDDAPWGFAPFHYGRWAYARRRLVLDSRAQSRCVRCMRPRWSHGSAASIGASRSVSVAAVA